MSVDSALFDDALAESLAEAGRGVREVWIRSTGTKLTDKGLSVGPNGLQLCIDDALTWLDFCDCRLALFEGCEELERLTLSEVQGQYFFPRIALAIAQSRLTHFDPSGRFSKSVWEKVEWPDTFKHLRIEISDVGPHHSSVVNSIDLFGFYSGADLRAT